MLWEDLKPRLLLSWEGETIFAPSEFWWKMYQYHARGDDKAYELMQALRDHLGTVRANALLFLLTGYHSTPENMKEMLTRYLDKDCTGTFFITEVPSNLGATLRSHMVAEVEIVEGQPGTAMLRILGPTGLRSRLPYISPTETRYTVVNGSARDLMQDEWEELLSISRDAKTRKITYHENC